MSTAGPCGPVPAAQNRFVCRDVPAHVEFDSNSWKQLITFHFQRLKPSTVKQGSNQGVKLHRLPGVAGAHCTDSIMLDNQGVAPQVEIGSKT